MLIIVVHLMGNKLLKWFRKVKLLNLKTIREKKLPLMIHADFLSILVPENNAKQITNELHNIKYQNHVGCSLIYKLICVVDQFSKSFKLYFAHKTVHKFISNMAKESKY